KNDETIMLIHSQKTYTKINGKQIRAQAEAMKHLLEGNHDHSSNNDTLQTTGKKEIISGYETEEYILCRNGLQLNFAIAKNFPNYQKLITTLHNIQNGPGMEIFRSMSLPPDKYPGMPIRTE